MREVDRLILVNVAELVFASLIGLRETERLPPPLTVESPNMLVFGPKALISLSSAY